MNILLLLITHSAWSVNDCGHSRAICEANPICRQQLYKYKSDCSRGSPSFCDDQCSPTAKALVNIVGEGCLCEIVPSIDCDQLLAALNGSACRASENHQQHGRVKRYTTSSNDEVIDGVSGVLHTSLISGTQSMSLSDKDDMLRRPTRSPLSAQIKQWKSELSGELQGTTTLDNFSCNRALYDVCLKHVSCRQLWNIFRTSCAVDASNQCVMTDREDCWQSYEGISWTGLGNCTCYDRNSDCHWIRLQTRYNKCIYEISLSGDFQTPISFLSRDWSPETEQIPEQHQISSDHFRLPNVEHRRDSSPVYNQRSTMVPLSRSGSPLELAHLNESETSQPRSIPSLSQNARPTQRHPLPSEQHVVASPYHRPVHMPSTSVTPKQAEKELERVRPSVQPQPSGAATVQPSRHIQFITKRPLHRTNVQLLRPNRTDRLYPPHFNRTRTPSLPIDIKSTHEARPSTMVKSEANHFIARQYHTSGEKNTTMNTGRSAQEVHSTQRPQLSNVASSFIKVGVRQTDDISTKLLAPTASSGPSISPSTDASVYAHGLVYTRGDTSKTDRYSAQRTTPNEKAKVTTVERKTSAYSTPVVSKYPWRIPSSNNSKLVASAPSVLQTTSAPSATADYGNRKAMKLTAQSKENQGSDHYNRNVQKLEFNKHRSNANIHTTEHPVTSIPQPPLNKTIRWNNAKRFDAPNDSLNQSTSISRSQTPKLKNATAIIKSSNQFRQNSSSVSTCVAGTSSL